MRDLEGRKVVRRGDVTDHGGKIIEGASAFTQVGLRVALDGYLVECPKCGGTFPIIATGKLTLKGKRVGDAAVCGAIVVRG